MSVAVATFATAIAAYLAWNPRGMPRSGISFFPLTDTTRAPRETFDPGQVIGEVADPVQHMGRDDSVRWRRHVARLNEAGFEVTSDEIDTVAGDTAYDAVASLRPYWLNVELKAAVRVGGQLVGRTEALHDIPLPSVDGMRLEFSVTEPHWIVQIFVK